MSSKAQTREKDYERGIRIANRRKEIGLSQDELAHRVGIGRQALSAIENGGDFKTQTLDNLAIVLGVSVDFILLSPLRFRIGEFWRLHSRGVLYLKHKYIVICHTLIADRVQATIMSCKHDNHFSTDTLFIAFIIARHCLICNSSISERTSIASDNSSDFSSFFPYIMKSTDTPSTIAR